MIYFITPLSLIFLSFLINLFITYSKNKVSTKVFLFNNVVRTAVYLSLLGLMYVIVQTYDYNFGEMFEMIDMIMKSV